MHWLVLLIPLSLLTLLGVILRNTRIFNILFLLYLNS